MLLRLAFFAGTVLTLLLKQSKIEIGIGTKERKRDGVLRKQVTGEIPQRHIPDRRQHGVAGDRGVIFIAFAGLVDSLMVSSLGSYAVAAVGLTTQPKLLGLAFFFALNVSISALVARRRGEQRQSAANETLVTALVFIILAAAAFSVGFVAFASPIIHLCGSTAQ